MPPDPFAATPASSSLPALAAPGQLIFRVETFGDEPLSTDKLTLHRVVQNRVDPGAALNVALQVDADVLPTALKSVAARLETGPPGSFLHRSNGFVIRLVEFA
jgi:hypothetical protein